MALERIDDTLRFLGGTEVTDYLGPTGQPEVPSSFCERLWGGVLERDDWRQADLRGLPEDSAWLPSLREAALGHGLAVEETEDQNGVAPFLDLPGTWDEYLQQIPSKLRHEIRRKAKKLEAEAGPFGIETATDETLLPLLDRFVDLHRLSEGPKGVFMVPGMEIFFRRLGETFCRPGVFRLAGRPEIVRHLRATEESKGVVDPFERNRGDLGASFVLAEREQQVVGLLAELFPVELQEVRCVEDRAGRIEPDELAPIPAQEVAGVF